MNFEIKIVQGKDAKELLQDNSFYLQWKELAFQDEKATVVQEPSFVMPWYQQYENRYHPVFVLGFDNRSNLVGCIPLAYSIKDKHLTYAGGHQAEYNGWICKKTIDQSFPIKALSALRHQYRLKEWKWKWLPPGSNGNWLFAEELNREKIHVSVFKEDSPLLDLQDEARIERMHRHRSLRTKINRYKNELRLERIVSFERAKEVFDILADQYDFRQMAAYGVTPFASDINKKPFYLNRLRYPENNHFTVLWSQDDPIAFNYGACDSNTFYPELSGYNPCEERNSPSAILFIKLIDLLIKEGYRYIDLSPGGNPYKERYNNLYQELYLPTFYFSRNRKLIGDLKLFVGNTIKKGLNINPANRNTWRKRLNTLLFVFKKVMSSSPTRTVKELISSMFHRKTNTLYGLSIKDQSNQDEVPDRNISVNKYTDLLKYDDSSYWISKRDLLSNALRQFSKKASVFTVVKNETLAHFGYIISGNDKNFSKVTGIDFELPVSSLAFYNITTNPYYMKQEFFTILIKDIVALSKSSNTEELFILVSGKKGVFNKAIELAGFEVYV